MIPVNLAIIGAGAQCGLARARLHAGGAYGAAMAAVYGAIGLVVILTAGTFGSINSSPWFNLGIAVLFVVLGLAMFDVLMIDFSRFGRQLPARRRPRFPCAGVHDGRRVGAARRRMRRTRGHPGRPVLEQHCTRPAPRSPSRCPSASASAWRCPGRSSARAWPRCEARGVDGPRQAGLSACSSSPPPFTTATRRTRCSPTRWVDPSAVQASVEAQVKSGWHNSLPGASPPRAPSRKPLLIDFWATWCKELSDDGQDDV